MHCIRIAETGVRFSHGPQIKLYRARSTPVVYVYGIDEKGVQFPSGPLLPASSCLNYHLTDINPENLNDKFGRALKQRP